MRPKEPRLRRNNRIYEIFNRKIGTPYGVRTRVAAVRGRRPRPLDEGRLIEKGFGTIEAKLPYLERTLDLWIFGFKRKSTKIQIIKRKLKSRTKEHANQGHEEQSSRTKPLAPEYESRRCDCFHGCSAATEKDWLIRV